MSGSVVYIDDEPAICRVFSLRVAREGAAVETFTDPEEAVRFVNRHDVSVVFCDYRMAPLGGLEVLDRIAADVPFYIVTGEITAADELADVPRVSGVVPKPFAFDEIRALIQGALEGASR